MSYRKVLITGIGLSALLFQNSAQLSGIETLVMPGPVSHAHAEIESECSECHAAFSKTPQRILCLSCHEHENISSDQLAGTGFHGRFEPARDVECSTCHSEHRGREADIVGLDMESFNHEFTDFPLADAHTSLPCESCHLADKTFRQTPFECFACHEEDDSHQGSMGEHCDSCHEQKNWQTHSFDHAADTEYKLTGAHEAVRCAVCHVNQRYEGTPTDCYSCHQINDQHQGEYGQDCKQCHQTGQWKDSTFDHGQVSDFALLGRHSEISCRNCHLGDLFDVKISPDCASCHLVDDVHQGSNGVQCNDCHDSKGWTKSTFDHQADTDFALAGAHRDLDCKACHSASSGGKALEVTCSGCHQLDDVHESGLGADCARCHQETSWTDEIQFDHGLGTFPLIGLHAIAPCEACHISREFSDTPAACVDCHEPNDVHQGQLGNECGACHNPNDWLLWEFDHNLSTEFVLEGAHSELECSSCHQSGDQYVARPSMTCAACHKSDDIHGGQFGRQCARCHDTGSFGREGTLQ